MANGVNSESLRSGTEHGGGVDPSAGSIAGSGIPSPAVAEVHPETAPSTASSGYQKGKGNSGAPSLARPVGHPVLARSGTAPAPEQASGAPSFPLYEFKKGDQISLTTSFGETKTVAEVIGVIDVGEGGEILPEPMVRVQFANLYAPLHLRGERGSFTQAWLSGFLTRQGYKLERQVQPGYAEWARVEPKKPVPVETSAEEMAQRVRALRLAFDPQFRKQEALKGHLEELTAERKDLDSTYKEWLKSQEDRVSVSLRRAGHLGRHDPLDIERYVNPEDKARWKRQFARLDRQIKVVRLGLKNVEAKREIAHNIPADDLWNDPLVIRMAFEEKNKRPITPEEDLDIESERMRRAHKRGDWEETLLCYASLQARYLAHTDGILRSNGGSTLTARINSLIRDGFIRTPLPMVMTSGDLEAILPEISAYNLAVAKKIGEAKRTNPHAEALYRGDFLDVRKVRDEIARLQKLEAQNQALSRCLRHAEKVAHKILREHRESPEVARIKGFGRGVLEVADDPNTWIMVLAGMVSGGLAGAVETRVVAAGVNAKKLNMAKPLLHGFAFHATFNLTQHAMLRHDQADWSAGAFAHSVAVMWWLGRVQKFYGQKVVPQYADFLAKRPAVLRTLNFTGSKTAEVAGLASLDLALATAHNGVGHLNSENIGAHLASSAQFVIAFGALNAGRSHGGKSPEQRGFELAKARFEKEATPEARRKMLEAQKTHLAHEIEQLEMAQGMQPDKRAGLKVAERFRRVELAKVEILQALEKMDQAKKDNPADAENLERTQQLLRDQLALLVEVEKVYLESFAQAQAKAEGETAGETGKPEAKPRPETREPPKTRLPREARIEELPHVEGEQGLEALVARIEAGKVYRLPSVDAQGRAETNYLFKDTAGNVYIIPAWAVAKTLAHQARGSKITVPVATILEMIAEGVAAQSVEGKGRYELHLKDPKGRVVGLDSVATEQEIEAKGLKGERATVERDLDNVEHFVVDDAVLADRSVYGSPELHAIFLDGNPEYAREVAESLKGHGIDPASWSPQGSHKGKVRVLITAFPGKYMPPRHVADAWRGHRTLMPKSEHEAWKAGREKLDKAGILKPVLSVRDKAMAGDVEGLRKMFATGVFAEFPEAYRAKIDKAIYELEAVLKKEGANPREVLMAKSKVAEFAEAALLRLKGIPIDEVRAGLVMPTDTPKKFKELAPVTGASSFAPQTGAPERSSRGYYGVRVNLEPQQLAPLMTTVHGAEARPLHTTPTEELHVTFLHAPEIKALIDKEPAEPGLSKTKATEKAKARVKEKLAAVFGSLKGRPVITGIGKATDEHGNTVYFATVEWPEAQAARRELGLPEKDLHITLASTGVNEAGLPIDSHGVPKKANIAALESPVAPLRRALEAYGREHKLRGLEGRIQRGLDPAGMLAVAETRAKLQEVASSLGASMEDVIRLTNELHIGGIWKNAPRLSEAKDPAVQVWMILGEATTSGKEVEGDLTEVQFLADYERVNRLLDEAVRDPKGFAERSRKSLVESSGKQFRMDGDVPVSDLDSGFLAMAIHGHRSGIVRDANGLLFVGADKLDYSALEKLGLRAEQREDRGRMATFYVNDKGEPVVKKLYDGFAIVLSKDIEIAKTLARTANPRAAETPAPEAPPRPAAKPKPSAGQSPNARMAEAAVEKARLIADELGAPELLAEATALRERVRGATAGDEKALKKELGALMGKIGPKWEQARQARKAREWDPENFAANLTDVARLALLEKEGILTADGKEQLARALAKFPQLAGEISARIQSAVGSVTAALREGDQKKMIAANNSLQGLLFELSRYEAKRNGGGVTPAIPQKQPLKVSYEGVRYREITRDGQTVVIEEAVTRTEAEVQEDVPIIEGHIWEVANYSRHNLGNAVEGKEQKRNQALKYEAAVKAGLVQGATIEIRGNIDPAFLTFLNQRCPNVEVLYSFILPGGREIVFPIRRAANGATIRPIDPPKNLTPSEAKVVRGIQRAIELGVLGEHLSNDLLSAEQVAKSPLAQELVGAIDPATGRVDPLRLKTLAAYHEYQRLMAERRWEIFTGLADKPNTHRSVDHLLQPMTEPEIDREFERLRAHFNNHPMIPTRRQYTVTDEEAAKVRAEFGKRLKAISEFESSRLASPDTTADQARQRLGYRGNRHGYPLDPEHIYQDVVKGVRPPPKLSPKQQRAGAGRWASRSYDMTDQFPTAGQVASDMQGGKFQEEKTVIEVRYPAGAKQGDPDMPVTRAIDISSESADPTQRASEVEKNRRGLVQQTLDENFDRFQEMNEAATAPDHLLISAKDVATSPHAAALKKALDPQTGRVNPEKITDPAVRAGFDRLVVQKRASVPETVRKRLTHMSNRPRIERAYAEYKSLYDAMVAEVRDPVNKDKQAIRAKHQPGIEAAKIKLLATYREALGQEGYYEYAIRLLEERTNNVRKFIYAVDANGEMHLFEEAMEAGSERPTHSMLAGGRNVYAAGELYIRVRGSEKPQVTVINNGSGHYRPDSTENLDYVKNILAQNGFDVGEAQLQHQRFPFVDLQDRPLEDLWCEQEPQPVASTGHGGRWGNDAGAVAGAVSPMEWGFRLGERLGGLFAPRRKPVVNQEVVRVPGTKVGTKVAKVASGPGTESAGTEAVILPAVLAEIAHRAETVWEIAVSASARAKELQAKAKAIDDRAAVQWVNERAPIPGEHRPLTLDEAYAIAESKKAREVTESLADLWRIIRATSKGLEMRQISKETAEEVARLAMEWAQAVELRYLAGEASEAWKEAHSEFKSQDPVTPYAKAFQEFALMGKAKEFADSLGVRMAIGNEATHEVDRWEPVTDDMMEEVVDVNHTPPEATRDINVLGWQHILAMEAGLDSMPESTKLTPEQRERVLNLLMEGKITLDDINRARGMGLKVREMEFLSHPDHLGSRPGWLEAFAKDPEAFLARMDNLLAIHQANRDRRVGEPTVRLTPPVQSARPNGWHRHVDAEAGSASIDGMTGGLVSLAVVAGNAVAGLFGRSPKPPTSRDLPVIKVAEGTAKVPTVRLFAVDPSKDNDIVVPGWERFTLGRNPHDLPSVQDGEKLVVGITDRRIGKSGKSIISKEHFSIRKTKDGWVLTDEVSANGTEIKQRGSKHWRKLEPGERAPLEPGDQIRVAGEAVWVFGMEGATLGGTLSDQQISFLRENGFHDLEAPPIRILAVLLEEEGGAVARKGFGPSIVKGLVGLVQDTERRTAVGRHLDGELKQAGFNPNGTLASEAGAGEAAPPFGPGTPVGRDIIDRFGSSPLWSRIDRICQTQFGKKTAVITPEEASKLVIALVEELAKEVTSETDKDVAQMNMQIYREAVEVMFLVGRLFAAHKINVLKQNKGLRGDFFGWIDALTIGVVWHPDVQKTGRQKEVEELRDKLIPVVEWFVAKGKELGVDPVKFDRCLRDLSRHKIENFEPEVVTTPPPAGTSATGAPKPVEEFLAWTPAPRSTRVARTEQPLLVGEASSLEVLRMVARMATERLGEFAGTTDEGADYGKKNEDTIGYATDAEGNLHLIVVDGVGGQDLGEVAAKVAVEAFTKVATETGNTEEAMKAAGQAIRDYWASHGLSPRSNSKPNAVAVSAKVIKTADGYSVQFFFTGDSRGALLVRGAHGWQWVYRTEEEGVASGAVMPGHDFEPGGAGRTIAMRRHVLGNVVTNTLAEQKVRRTEDGEVPDPANLHGIRRADGLEGGIPLPEGALVLLGSDGLWENFGHTRYLLELIKDCQTAEDVVQVLREETHLRMEMMAKVKAEIKKTAYKKDRLGNMGFKTKRVGLVYQGAYAPWRGKTLYIEKNGSVFDSPDSTKAIDHFKNDNVSVFAYLHNPKPSSDGRLVPETEDAETTIQDPRPPVPGSSTSPVRRPTMSFGSPVRWNSR